MDPSAPAASTLDAFGFGARGMAMANAQTAAVDDSSANYYNPAILALAPALRIDAGYLATFTKLRLDGRDLDVDENNGVMTGIVIPGDIGPVRLALGLGLYLPDTHLTRVRALPQSQPRFVMLDNRTHRLHIGVNLAIRILPELAIGGGITFLAGSEGGVALTGTFFPSPDDTALVTSVGVDFKTVRSPQAGISWEPFEGLRLGLAWRGQVQAKLDLGADVVGSIAELLGPEPIDGELSVRSINTNFFSPHQVFLGVAFRPEPMSLLALDLGWLHWSAYPPPTAAIGVDFQLEGFDTSGLLPEPVAVTDPNFHDIVVVRFGAERRIELAQWAELDVRAGYGFEPSPAPSQPGITNYVDSAKHMLTLGLGAGFLDAVDGVRPIQIDFGVQHHVYSPRRYDKDSPADPVGDYVADGHVWAVSTTARFAFPW
jgi:long-subunit fatty acid transport protein